MKQVPWRKTLSLVLVFSIVTLSLIVLDRQHLLTPIKDGLNTVVQPVSGAFSRIPDSWDSNTPLEDQLATAVAKADRLDTENSDLKAQNDKLQVQLKLQTAQEAHPDREYVTAEVLSRDPTGQQKFLVIDKGSADGLRVGMAVVDPNYFVGQISEVSEHNAKVMLIIDSSMKVGARLEDTQAEGTVVGTWQGGQQPMIMEHIDKTKTPKEGEKIVTSDMTRQIPPGIIIGVVWGEPVVNAQNDQIEVKVRPVVDFDSLTQVFVVTNYGN
ncbi:MAG: rod shape-determining protein MreC [Thermomicrobiales bacterium]